MHRVDLIKNHVENLIDLSGLCQVLRAFDTPAELAEKSAGQMTGKDRQAWQLFAARLGQQIATKGARSSPAHFLWQNTGHVEISVTANRHEADNPAGPFRDPAPLIRKLVGQVRVGLIRRRPGGPLRFVVKGGSSLADGAVEDMRTGRAVAGPVEA